MKRLAFDSVTVLSRLENLRDCDRREKTSVAWYFVVTLVAALSIVPMAVTTPWIYFKMYRYDIVVVK